MGIASGSINVVGSELQYALPPSGSAASKYVLPFELDNTLALVLFYPDGVTPYDVTITLSQNVSDYIFTIGGASGQIKIQCRGGGATTCTFIIPAEITEYVSGGGFSGSGEIEISAVSDFYDPVDDPYHQASWRFDDPSLLTSGGFPIADMGGNYDLIADAVNTSVLPGTVTDGTLKIDQNSPVISPVLEDSNNRYVAFLISLQSNNENFAAWLCMTLGDPGAINVLRGTYPSNPRGAYNEVDEWWQGVTDGSGNPVINTRSTFDNDWGIIIVRFTEGVPVARLFGGVSSGTVDRAVENVDFEYIGFFSATPDAATENSLVQKLQGYLAYLGAERSGNAKPVSYFLPTDHPYYSAPPGGGRAGSVEADTPVLTVTISGFPVGSEVRIYSITGPTDTNFGSELVGVESSAGTTITYSGGTPGNWIMIQILSTGFKELLRPVEIPTVSQTIDISQDLEAEDAFG